MLINCPECGKEISETAKKCPNCGFKQKTKKNKASMKQWIIAGVAIIGVVSLVIYLLLPYLPNQKPDDISDEVYDVGCASVKVIDRYLDREISGDDASERLEELHDEIKHIDDKPGDGLVSIKISFLKSLLWQADSDILSTSRSDVLKERNELAEYLNIEKRD